MSNAQSPRKYGLVHTLRKYFVSAFVVFTFAAYAIHERANGQSSDTALLPLTPSGETRQSALIPPTDDTGTSLHVPTETPFPTSVPPTSDVMPVNLPAATTTRRATSVPPTAVPPSAIPPSAVPPTAVPPTAVPPTAKPKGLYKDGQYTGNVADAFYGNVQVKAVISNGRIADVQFLDYPRDRRTSQRINSVAVPYLKSEAIQAQNAQVNIISGATLTSQAFIESLQTALANARN